ncbi:MAG: aminomethyl transferase family protein [Halobacteriaceae archaeon]
MTVVEELHASHGARFETRGDRTVVADYGRPVRTLRAVRNVVGTIEMAYGILAVSKSHRTALETVLSEPVPDDDRQGVYTLIIDGEGALVADAYAYVTPDRLLLFVPPGREMSVKRVVPCSARLITSDLGVFGVHGPKATEKIASVLHGTGAPDEILSFVRGELRDAGVTVIRSDNLPGEEGYEIVCSAEVANDVFDALITLGLNATPFGHSTWETLTLEAGTPLFDPDLRTLWPANPCLGNVGLDRNSPCRLYGVSLEGLAPNGATIVQEESSGLITRAVESPIRGHPIGFAVLDPSGGAIEGVKNDGQLMASDIESLPFVSGSGQSKRTPDHKL